MSRPVRIRCFQVAASNLVDGRLEVIYLSMHKGHTNIRPAGANR